MNNVVISIGQPIVAGLPELIVAADRPMVETRG